VKRNGKYFSVSRERKEFIIAQFLTGEFTLKQLGEAHKLSEYAISNIITQYFETKNA
tara:strand:+ start:338 stop:508 length:171 start_codon:yes stop_codon:yes gene_type:complete